MVETPSDGPGIAPAEPGTVGNQPVAETDWNSTPSRGRPYLRKTLLPLAVVLAAGAALAIGQPGGTPSIQASAHTDATRTHIVDPTRGHDDLTSTAPATTSTSSSTPTSTTTVPAPTAPALSPKPQATSEVIATPSVTPPATGPSVATLVAEVEASGIDPGSSWTWSMGDPSAQCHFVPGTSVGSGCTFGAAGSAQSVFAGAPSLALVAHELANAETENDAVPSLMNEVNTAEAGTSWSPIDAVASCLVEHFMGFQDDAAGSWQCSAGLAAVVAENIHDTVVTTEMTSICGTKSGIVSTLIFTGTTGTLTVTGPAVGAPPQTVAEGTPVTVSGIGTFTAIDHGGAIDQTGKCTS